MGLITSHFVKEAPQADPPKKVATPAAPPKDRLLRVILVHLNASGKETSYIHVRQGSLATTIPTVIEDPTRGYGLGYGGRTRISAYRRHFYYAADVVVFVVQDLGDNGRLAELRETLHAINKELVNLPLLIVPSPEDAPTLAHSVKLAEVLGQRLWRVVPAVIRNKTDDGWKVGLQWLAQASDGDQQQVAAEEAAAAMKAFAAINSAPQGKAAVAATATATTPAIAA